MMMMMMKMVIRLLFIKVQRLQLRRSIKKQQNKDTKMITGKTYNKHKPKTNSTKLIRTPKVIKIIIT